MMTIEKIFSWFIGSFIFSVLIVTIFWLLSDFVFHTYQDNTVILVYILPITFPLGIFLTDKIYYRNQRWNILGIIIAIALNILALFIGYYSGSTLEKMDTDKTRSMAYIALFLGIPLLMMIFTIIGYNLGDRNIFKKNQEIDHLPKGNIT